MPTCVIVKYYQINIDHYLHLVVPGGSQFRGKENYLVR